MKTVRRLTPVDAEDYVALRQEMLVDAPWAFSASAEDDRGVRVEQVRAMLSGAETAVLGCFADERLVGVAGLNREAKLKRAHIVWVWGVYVTRAARAQGVARAMVGAAIEAARGLKGVDRVQLSVSENSPGAQRVYESLGFKEWGREPDALRTGGRSFIEIHMSLTL